MTLPWAPCGTDSALQTEPLVATETYSTYTVYLSGFLNNAFTPGTDLEDHQFEASLGYPATHIMKRPRILKLI